MTEKIRESLIENNVSSIAKSYRSLGKKVFIDSGVKRKEKKVPKSDQKQRMRQMLKKLVKNFVKPSNELSVVLNDESYLTVDGNGFYFEYEGLEVAKNVKFEPIRKLPKKKLPKKTSEKNFRKRRSLPLIVESGNAIDANRYIDNCL